jgi:hypothetical protein
MRLVTAPRGAGRPGARERLCCFVALGNERDHGAGAASGGSIRSTAPAVSSVST